MQHATFLASLHRCKLFFGILASIALICLVAFACVQPAHAVTAAEKQAEAEEALANLNAMQETLDRLSAEYGEAQMAQEKAEKKRDAAEKRIKEIKSELNDLQDHLNERARDMYRTGGVPFLDMILGASTFEEFATSLDMATKVNQSNADMIDHERELKKEAEDQAVVLDEQAAIAAQKSVEAEQAAAQAQETVAELDALYANLSAEAEQLLEEERKAREAEEKARAAAVLAAAKAQAEEEERARAAAAEAAAEQAAADAESDQDADADASANDGADDSAADDNGNASTDDSQDEADNDGASQDGDGENAEDGQDAGAPEEEAAPAEESGATYEGGSDTVSRARACIGAPYVWGGVGPNGYDCSGLVSYCLTGSHSRLGTTYTFMNWPAVSDPQPGDIAVNSGHTGVYIGGGQMIHASTYGVGVIEGPVQAGMKIVRYPG